MDTTTTTTGFSLPDITSMILQVVAAVGLAVIAAIQAWGKYSQWNKSHNDSNGKNGPLSQQMERSRVESTRDMQDAVKDDGDHTRADVADFRTFSENQATLERGIELGIEKERKRIRDQGGKP